MVGMIYEDETGFEERVASPLPTSESSDDDDSADEQNGTVAESNRKYRGNGLLWEEYIDPITKSHESFMTFEAVTRDAIESDYSKRGSSGANSQIYVCRSKGCRFLKKYRQIDSTCQFYSCYNGVHSHGNDIGLEDDHRGLTGEQKLIVEEAFGLGRRSARQIISLFRSKRSQLTDDSLKNFPLDPQLPKLKNFIQAFKKKNGSMFNPTPHHLKEWCERHCSATVDLEKEETYTIPFVLDYLLVRYGFA